MPQGDVPRTRNQLDGDISMNRNAKWLVSIFGIFLLLSVALFSPATARAEESKASSSESSLYLKVQFDSKLKASSLTPGDTVEGILSRNVYWRDREVLPAGSRVRLVVDTLERRRRERNDHWPWVVQAFTPRHEKYPTFHAAEVLLPDGRTVSLKLSLLSVGKETTARMEARKSVHSHAALVNADLPQERKPEDPQQSNAGFTARFMADSAGTDLIADPEKPAAILPAGPVTLAAGTQARIILLQGVSASGNHPGDTIRAQLVEPLYADSLVVLPAGTIFEGKVVKSQAPRMLSRSGSLVMSFTALTAPDGTTMPVVASVAGVDLNVRSKTVVDPEGGLHGDRPGIGWMLINLAVTGGMSKAVDDGTQLVLEAIIASATDASTAGTARIVAACVSGVFMLTRHGRDVILPKYTELEIAFDRPVALSH
jgi:hypothetical protein